jgi:hypothetical protein
MTDRELVLDIGNLLIRREIRIAALTAELQMYRDENGQRLDWRANVQRTIESPEQVFASETRVEALKTALDAATPDVPPVRILHQFLVG